MRRSVSFTEADAAELERHCAATQSAVDGFIRAGALEKLRREQRQSDAA